jgi:predicted nuclease of predicted toxin-antitoxin system
VKFLVDAQLPRRLVRQLTEAGHDALHTLDLPLGNCTPDKVIVAMAEADSRVVVTKDSDFVTLFSLRGQPRKLLLISTGNISNDELSLLLAANLSSLEKLLTEHDFVELGIANITVHA